MAYAASIGFFDGVHRGHHYLIKQLQSLAQQREQQTMLITFSSHPRRITDTECPHLLLASEERRLRLESTAVHRVLFLDFPSIQPLTAEEFLRLLHDQYDVHTLLMGYDHHFGSDRLPAFNDYQQAGQRTGIDILQATQSPEGAISSTKIRQALLAGNITQANHDLGYEYTLSGTVIHGQHIGTSIGFPTANLLLPPDKLIPAPGVYAARVEHHKAIVNIGTNPTFADNAPVSIEVHIPHFSANLYGQRLAVQLIAYIRPDQRFPSQQELINQINHDLVHLDEIIP